MEKTIKAFFGNRWYYHSAFWLLYNGFWHVLFSPVIFAPRALLVSVAYFFCHIAGSYLNIYWLVPRFMDTKRYGQYAILLILDILFFSALLSGMLILSYNWFYPGRGLEIVTGDMSNFLGSVLGSTSSTILVVMVIKTSKEKILFRARAQANERERLKTEVKFLKSQLNPHFLFNAINNIYFLIRKDPDAAANALAKFSEILRYQLYECNDDKILLAQELQYLNSYITLSSLSKNRLKVKVDITEKVNGEMIAPIVLMPLVENAFKHVSDFKDRPNWIDIRLQLQDRNLLFSIENSRKPKEEDSTLPGNEASGIGMENIKRRLQLSYPESHHLTLAETPESYRVSLTLPI